jgi:hypothetical protein
MPRDNGTGRTARSGTVTAKMSGDAWAGVAIAAALKTYGVLANLEAGRDRSGKEAGRPHGASPTNARGAGEGATKPTQIPKAGWWAILKRTWAQMSEDNVSMLAGGVAFFAMLSIFPALTAMVSLYGLVADPRTVEQQVAAMGAVIILLFWFYITSYVILAGGELNAEIERQTARDTTTEPERSMGNRGARMADTVAS